MCSVMNAFVRIVPIVFLGSVLVSSSLGRSQMPFNASSDFGRKHFIVGFPHDQYSPKTASKKESDNSCIGNHCGYVARVLFSPDDDPRQHFIDLINQEKKSIKIAIFNLTDPSITQALINAQKDRNVDVQIIYEPSTSKERYSKIKHLKHAGISVFEYDPDYAQDKRSNILHHKFTIFETAHNNQPCVWAGSLNLTSAASERNQEDIAILVGSVVDRYSNRFDCIKKERCIGCSYPKNIKVTHRHISRNKKHLHA